MKERGERTQKSRTGVTSPPLSQNTKEDPKKNQTPKHRQKRSKGRRTALKVYLSFLFYSCSLTCLCLVAPQNGALLYCTIRANSLIEENGVILMPRLLSLARV